jgi:Dolichyl-phosphate-mannose-protein mannosyltransferase
VGADDSSDPTGPGQDPRDRKGRDDQGPPSGYVLVLLGVITLGGLLLRLPSFNGSLAGDEISTYYIVMGHSLGRVLQLVHSNQETTPPLYFIVAWATKGLLGSPAQSIRLVSLLTGTAAIPLTFLLGLWTVGRRAAMVGAACISLSPYMIFFSTSARPYMMVLFFALLSTLALLRALDSGRWAWWAAYAAFTSAAAYSHYTVVFLLVAQVAWALWTQPQARRALVVANVAAGLTYLPWIPGLREDLNAPNFISSLVPVSFHTLYGIVMHMWIGHPTIPLHSLPGDLAVVLAVTGLALGLIGLLIRMRGGRWAQWRPSPRAVLVIVLAVAPAVLVAVYSWTRVDILGGGNVIGSWPALAIVIGALVTSPTRPLRLAAVTLTLGAFAIGGIKMISPSAQQTDVNAAVAFIRHTGDKGAPIVSMPIFANPLSELDVALADGGQRRNHPVLRLGVPTLAEQLSSLAGPNPQPTFFGLAITPPQSVARQAAALARHGTIFFVGNYGPSPALLKYYPDNPLSIFAEALPPQFHMVQHVTFPNLGVYPESVYVYRDTGSSGRRSR